jgi:hypothetical protein
MTDLAWAQAVPAGALAIVAAAEISLTRRAGPDEPGLLRDADPADHTSAAAGKASSSGQDRTVLGWSRTVPDRSAGTTEPETVSGPEPAPPGPR